MYKSPSTAFLLMTLCLGAILPVRAQSYSPDARRLIVWVIVPAEPTLAPGAARPDFSYYHERDAGSFGQAASEVGTAAGNYGKTPSDLPNASSTATSASDHGKNAGDFGQAASSYGASLSSINSESNLPLTEASHEAAEKKKGADLVRTQLRNFLTSGAEQLVSNYDFVDSGKVIGELSRTYGTEEYPDVIIGCSLSAEVRRETAATFEDVLLSSGIVDQGDLGGSLADSAKQAHIEIEVRRHISKPDASRNLLQAVSERALPRSNYDIEKFPEPARAISKNAIAAVGRILHGEHLQERTDREIADVDSPLALRSAVLSDAEGLDLLGGIDLLDLGYNEQLATVLLRAVVTSDLSVVVLHPVVVLRKAADGQWNVLQVSLNLAPQLQGNVVGELHPTTKLVDILSAVQCPKARSETHNQYGHRAVQRRYPDDCAKPLPPPATVGQNSAKLASASLVTPPPVAPVTIGRGISQASPENN